MDDDLTFCVMMVLAGVFVVAGAVDLLPDFVRQLGGMR